jgi:ribose 5-phosphate isomerase B
MPTETIAIGADDAAIELKDLIVAHLASRGHTVTDYGVARGQHTPYPDVACTVAEAIAAGRHARGIIICGTGIGVAIAANKVPGIRAAVCHDLYSTQRSRMSNNCQIMTMGARVIGPELAKSLVDVWLAAEFQGGASAEKVDRICAIEDKYGRADHLPPACAC